MCFRYFIHVYPQYTASCILNNFICTSNTAGGDYYVMLYLNGFTSDTAVMHPRYAYFADGDLSQFDLYEEGLFVTQNTPLTDGSAFSSFMNEVIKERLEQ